MIEDPDFTSLPAPVLAYAAGIVDGEGHVGINGNHKNRNETASVQVANTYLPLLEWLRDRFGGSIRDPHKNNPQRGRDGGLLRIVWRWEVRGPRARAVLRAVGPYLLAKGPQAREVLTFFDGPPGGTHRDAVRARLKTLRREGFAGPPR